MVIIISFCPEYWRIYLSTCIFMEKQCLYRIFPSARVVNIFVALHYYLLSNFMFDERATLARAMRVVVHSYLYLGLRSLVRGKISSDNGNLRNLRYTKNSCHVILTLVT